ncbi:NAD(+)/NADH kinase, partial [Prochlorococcus sp. AH-736-B08]|nr:NAD(+)/NADH kinase [Prochlorococcus sp. AH-736-B08]
MKLSLVLIIYRSDSSIALEASKFCEESLASKDIKSNRIESDFNKNDIEKYLCDSELKPNIGIVLGGDGTLLKCANALANYDIPLLSIN